LTERAINDPQRMQDRGRDRGEDAVQDVAILHSGSRLISVKDGHSDTGHLG
jgi:hypothetical protein